MDRYFSSCYGREALSVELKQPHCFLLFSFLRIEKHSYGNGLKFLFLPFLNHIPLFYYCFSSMNTTSARYSSEIKSTDLSIAHFASVLKTRLD